MTFSSPEELKQMLEYLGLGLHAKNRVTGESGYRWHVAELIRAVGRLCDLDKSDREINRDFGDGYTPGRLDRTQQWDRIFELLQQQSRRK